MKKNYCGESVHLKFEDSEGYGWCDLLEEADVNCGDEACCEFEYSPVNEFDYERSDKGPKEGML